MVPVVSWYHGTYQAYYGTCVLPQRYTMAVRLLLWYQCCTKLIAALNYYATEFTSVLVVVISAANGWLLDVSYIYLLTYIFL